jgi:hypothetical protein
LPAEIPKIAAPSQAKFSKRRETKRRPKKLEPWNFLQRGDSAYTGLICYPREGARHAMTNKSSSPSGSRLSLNCARDRYPHGPHLCHRQDRMPTRRRLPSSRCHQPLQKSCQRYGCWLDTITEAIDTVDLSFTGEPDSFRARLDGARRGVFALIFHTSSRTNAILPTGNNFVLIHRYQHQRHFHHRARRTGAGLYPLARTEPAFRGFRSCPRVRNNACGSQRSGSRR